MFLLFKNSDDPDETKKVIFDANNADQDHTVRDIVDKNSAYIDLTFRLNNACYSKGKLTHSADSKAKLQL